MLYLNLRKERKNLNFTNRPSHLYIIMSLFREARIENIRICIIFQKLY